MKSFADPSFFRVIDILVADGSPTGGPFRTAWRHAGVDWERERHSFTGGHYAFVTEVCAVSHRTEPAWRLLIVNERWQCDERGDGTRHVRWARLVGGRRDAALAWLRAQEKALEQRWAGHS